MKGRPRKRGSVAGRSQRHFSLPKGPTPALEQLMTTHLHLVPKLKTRRAVPPLPHTKQSNLIRHRKILILQNHTSSLMRNLRPLKQSAIHLNTKYKLCHLLAYLRSTDTYNTSSSKLCCCHFLFLCLNPSNPATES